MCRGSIPLYILDPGGKWGTGVAALLVSFLRAPSWTLLETRCWIRQIFVVILQSC